MIILICLDCLGFGRWWIFWLLGLCCYVVVWLGLLCRCGINLVGGGVLWYGGCSGLVFSWSCWSCCWWSCIGFLACVGCCCRFLCFYGWVRWFVVRWCCGDFLDIGVVACGRCGCVVVGFWNNLVGLCWLVSVGGSIWFWCFYRYCVFFWFGLGVGIWLCWCWLGRYWYGLCGWRCGIDWGWLVWWLFWFVCIGWSVVGWCGFGSLLGYR